MLVGNRRAGFKYEIVATYEAGIELTGGEVKTLAASHGRLDEAFVALRGGELVIVNMQIPKYKFDTRPGHEETRTRRLLMHKHEIAQIALRKKQEKLTAVPLKVYWRHGKIKVEIALARGKRKFDKREAIKKREDARRMREY